MSAPKSKAEGRRLVRTICDLTAATPEEVLAALDAFGWDERAAIEYLRRRMVMR